MLGTNAERQSKKIIGCDSLQAATVSRSLTVESFQVGHPHNCLRRRSCCPSEGPQKPGKIETNRGAPVAGIVADVVYGRLVLVAANRSKIEIGKAIDVRYRRIRIVLSKPLDNGAFV